MIYFNEATRTFNLILRTSYYACQVDAENRLVHLGWGIRPADANDAVSSGAYVYEPGTLDWSFVVQYRPDEILTFGDTTLYQETLKVSFPTLGQPLANDEAAHLPIRDVRLRYVRHSIVTDAVPGLAPQHRLPTQNTASRETLKITLQDPVQNFTVIACYRLTPEHDILERWLELENHGAETITVETCFFASLHLPHGTTELTSVSGSWAREFMQNRQRLAIGTYTLESRTLQTGHGTNPFFMLNRPNHAWEDSGTVYFGVLAYSGSWRISFEQLPTWDVRIHAGYNPFDFELKLQPNECHITPTLVCGVGADGWGGASRRLHAFTQEWVLPKPMPRPVLYNSWEATYFDLSVENQIELARKAAAIGVELFCVDDGWFGARRSDRAGLGDWAVSQDIFPQGLEPLVEEVHRLGMRFGLWVEPEMVNPDSDLYRAHPDWVLHFPGRPRTEARNQLSLDFGRPEVVDYIFALLDALVRRYSVSFFKWDMNRYASEPGSVAGKAIWRKHVEAIYGIMDRLRTNHPVLDIQSCSGGGGRIDLGILARTDQVWVSDNTDAYDRLQIQEGFVLAYPARCMEAWVTHESNHITKRVTSLGLRFDVAMRGALGIGSSLNQLSDVELAEYARYIAFYKKIRPIVQNGALYRLELLEEFGASVWEYVLPDGSEAVFSLALHTVPVGTFRPSVALKGLRSHATYAIFDVTQKEVHRALGYDLMTLGLPRTTPEHVGESHTLHVKIVEEISDA